MKISLDTVADRMHTAERWREDHRIGARTIIWNNSYGAPELSLVLDPTTTGLEDLSATDRRVILGYCMAMDGKTGWCVAGGAHARKSWGIAPSRFGLKDADKAKLKSALFGMSTELGYFLKTEEKARGSRKMALAPSQDLDGHAYRSSRQRSVANLKTYDLGSCPVPKSIASDFHFRDLDDLGLELLFMLYGLNDLARHGGVDPTHLHVEDNRLVISDSFFRTWRYGVDELVLSLTALYEAELVSLVPATIEWRRWFPSADPQAVCHGDCDDPGCGTFVVRPVHQVERFAGSRAA